MVKIESFAGASLKIPGHFLNNEKLLGDFVFYII